MNNLITEIKNYILLIEKKFNLEISVHPKVNEHLISASELFLFNIHRNSHCVYINTFPCAHERCIDHQNKIFNKCKSGSYCETCHAGVLEYIYPFYNIDTLVGFICVSGYKAAGYNSYIEKCSAENNIPYEKLKNTISGLKEKMPDKDFTDTLLLPLVRMIEHAYIKPNTITSKDDIIHNIIKYMNLHYSEDITLNHICDVFSCSRSSISHRFKKETNQSFRNYLILLRLNAAKSLLSHSRLTVTEIAYSVGFCDSNYFSNVFKKYVGVSPRTFRQQNT